MNRKPNWRVNPVSQHMPADSPAKPLRTIQFLYCVRPRFFSNENRGLCLSQRMYCLSYVLQFIRFAASLVSSPAQSGARYDLRQFTRQHHDIFQTSKDVKRRRGNSILRLKPQRDQASESRHHTCRIHLENACACRSTSSNDCVFSMKDVLEIQ